MRGSDACLLAGLGSVSSNSQQQKKGSKVLKNEQTERRTAAGLQQDPRVYLPLGFGQLGSVG